MCTLTPYRTIVSEPGAGTKRLGAILFPSRILGSPASSALLSLNITSALPKEQEVPSSTTGSRNSSWGVQKNTSPCLRRMPKEHSTDVGQILTRCSAGLCQKVRGMFDSGVDRWLGRECYVCINRTPSKYSCVHVRKSVRACMQAGVRACVRSCVRACVRACVCVHWPP